MENKVKLSEFDFKKEAMDLFKVVKSDLLKHKNVFTLWVQQTFKDNQSYVMDLETIDVGIIEAIFGKYIEEDFEFSKRGYNIKLTAYQEHEEDGTIEIILTRGIEVRYWVESKTNGKTEVNTLYIDSKNGKIYLDSDYFSDDNHFITIVN